MSRAVVVSLLALGACHPLTPFVPPPLSNDAPRVLRSTSSRPHRDVRVVVDDLAIPHIYGDDDDDLAYGLGVMHGRDRGSQIYLLVHAAEGRLTEMLGDGALAIDRENRLLGYRMDEQIAALSLRDRALIESYCAGVNDGERMVGEAPELKIFGVRWEPLKLRDVVALWRFTAWSQSEGLNEELARFHLLKALGAASPVTRDLLRSVPSGGVPIVGAPFARAATTAEHDLREHSGGAQRGASVVGDARVLRARDAVLQSLRHLASGGSGASNSWSVAPEHTASNVAVLANDPHLPHYAPGVFYLVDLEDEHGVRAAGGTFPGIPIVIIGQGRDVAWGMTNAYADTQDAVIIEPTRDGKRYVVDGGERDFGHVVQRFVIGHGNGARVVEETWRTTMFGPVLPKSFGKETMNGSLVDDDDTFALLWTGFEFPHDNGRVFSAMWDLAASRDVDDATRALQDAFAAPAMSFNLAFTDGTIAYRLSGIVPVRAEAARVDFPRNGTSHAAGWSGRLRADEKPQVTRPPQGYIVAANQRVVEDGAPAQAEVGFEANQPWRALRIEERVRALTSSRRAAADDLFAIEQDITAGDAVRLAPIIGAHCPKHIDGRDDALVARFCSAIATFDGVFRVDARAIPYVRAQRALVVDAVAAHVSMSLASTLAAQNGVAMAVLDDVVRAHAGEHTALFGDAGLDPIVARAVKDALDVVVDETGARDEDWRWGKLHTLTLASPLAAVPILGALFTNDPVEESGFTTSPRAEAPSYDDHLRVFEGAGLRMIAEMTTPPTVRMINDSGESGYFGSPHMTDQNVLWRRGDARRIARPWDDAQPSVALLIEPALR